MHDAEAIPDATEAQEVALTLAEFIIRLDIRPTATPDVREAAAIEKAVGLIYEGEDARDALEEIAALGHGAARYRAVDIAKAALNPPAPDA
jgi:hypothetical protein